MTKPARSRLHTFFRNATAATALAMTSTSGMAQPAPAMPVVAAQDNHGWRSHRDQGQCPLPGANTSPAVTPFNFAANPRE